LKLGIGVFKNPGYGFRLITWTILDLDTGKIQDDQKMPGSGLWIQEKSRLDPDPDRSLIGTFDWIICQPYSQT